jgi:hypothetical protein
VSNCAADVRDILTDLTYLLEHAATATGTTSTVATNITATATVAVAASISGAAVDSMQADEVQADIGNTSRVNNSDHNAKSDSQYIAGHEYSANHTAAVAVVGSSAVMVSDDREQESTKTDQQHNCQHNSRSTQAHLPSALTAAGTARYF